MRLLERRLAAERKAGSADAVGKFVAEQERWTTLVRGGLLPTFFQTPPPLFSLKPADQPVRVLAFGDYGDGSAAQKQVAGAMLRYHQQRPFDFAITLGDNFYPAGMDSPTDPRWDTWWSALYDPLKIHVLRVDGEPRLEPVEQSRGGDPVRRSAARAGACRRRTTPSRPDRCSSSRSTPTSSPRRSCVWLAEELDRSRATWKVVYGHHPIYSEGQHEDNNQKIKQLLPVLKDRADVYIAGHDHDMQHLKPEGRAALLRRRERRQAPADRAGPAVAVCQERARLRGDRCRRPGVDGDVRGGRSLVALLLHAAPLVERCAVARDAWERRPVLRQQRGNRGRPRCLSLVCNCDCWGGALQPHQPITRTNSTFSVARASI